MRPAAPGDRVVPSGRFWTALEGGSLRCQLCHHRCVLATGASGICGVRRNDDGELVLPRYGRVTSAAVDPIEKKPLYHFRPGQSVFSIGFIGCNLKCPFCQNWTISQDRDAPSEFLSPSDVVRLARDARCRMVAYTYSEPLVHAEYLLDCMGEARKAGLANILVTNGHALTDAAREILELTDAANVDLKSWNSGWYRDELGGDLPTVQHFLELAAGLTHLEVTTLVIPGCNDNPEEMRGIAGFLASLSPDIPLHLSAYRPMYKYSSPPTPASLLERLAKLARENLRYVYLGNVSGASDTLCASCKAVLVHREGYRISVDRLSATPQGVVRCSVCGAEVPIILPPGGP